MVLYIRIFIYENMCWNNTATAEKLKFYAELYETVDFLKEDPSFFMHQVYGQKNQETLAFIASCLSYGNRKQFFPKIQFILDSSQGEIYKWVKNGAFKKDIPDTQECYYRLYTKHTMNCLLYALQEMINEYGSIKIFIQNNANDGFSAIASITNFFSRKGIEGIIPKDTTSSCKRICMFLRWMVRDKSPVDLGIWSDIIDKRTLIVPMDTHVVQQAYQMKLLNSRTTSMSVACKLTSKLLKIFPDDPLKGDFALFGYGVNHKTR